MSERKMYRWRGRQWRVAVDGRTAVVEDSVGMRYLAVLLASPGTEIAAVDLAGAGSAALSMQPVLDRTAVARYRQRLALLGQELDGPAGGQHAQLRAEAD